MELGLETTVSRLSATGLQVEIAGPVLEAHVAFLEADRPERKTPALKRISDRHHSLARSIASGMPQGQAAAIHGYNYAHTSVLMSDPAFRELVDVYRSQINMEMNSLHSKLAMVAGSALNQLQDRLEEEDLPVNQLLNIAQMGADRVGAGPSSTNVQVNIHANLADRMRAARERAMRASGTLIEGTPNAE